MNRNPLSKDQKRILGIEAMNAFAVESAAGRLHLPPDVATVSKTAQAKFWKEQVIARITQRVVSTNDIWQDEYLDVKREFERLSGNMGKAYNTSVRKETDAACHRAPGCEYVRDMHHWLEKAEYKAGYATVIMFGKFKTRDITDLKEYQLKQLHDTVVNRCRAKLGLGAAENRNKKQRADAGAGSMAQGAGSQSTEAKPGRDYVLTKPTKFVRPAKPAPTTVPDDDEPPPF